jgi:hypothetical protein
MLTLHEHNNTGVSQCVDRNRRVTQRAISSHCVRSGSRKKLRFQPDAGLLLNSVCQPVAVQSTPQVVERLTDLTTGLRVNII